MKAAEKQITNQLAQRLAHKGFRKRKNGSLTKVCGEGEAQIRCAVRKDKMSGKLLVTMMIGIRFESIEGILAEKGNEPDSPTIVTPIYSLHETGRSKEWDVESDATVDALAAEIDVYAIPFFEQYSTIDAIGVTLEEDRRPFCFWMIPEVRIQTFAAVLTLRGKKDAALALLNREIAARQNSAIPPQIAWRDKFQKLRERVSQSQDPEHPLRNSTFD